MINHGMISEIKMIASASSPDGWFICDGSAVSRTTYSDLFSLIGTAYGIGDGSTTFNIPDGRGRTFIGAGTGPGLSARTVGQTLGEENHSLSESELAIHHHSYNFTTVSLTSPGPLGAGVDYNIAVGSAGGDTGNTGSSSGHNNMQPSIVGNWIIKY